MSFIGRLHFKNVYFQLVQLLSNFKGFSIQRSLFDMAVGIVLGSSFSKLVNELVNSIVLPPLCQAIFGVALKNLKVVLIPANLATHNMQKAFAYGAIIQWLLNCSITLFCIVVIIKAISATRKASIA